MRQYCVLAVLLLLGSCASPPQTSSPSSQSSAPAVPAVKTVSKADFEKVQTGMTLPEVEKILGGKGEEATSSTVELAGQSIKTVSYNWKNPDFSVATVTFQNDKVTAKMQINLK